MTTTFRTDVAAALFGIADDYVTANPTLLKRAYRSRPASFPDLPLAFVGGRSEPEIAHDSGTRRRTLLVPLVLVDIITDNDETMARLDPLVDALLDELTAQPSAVPGTVLEPLSVEATEYDLGGVPYEAAVITCRARIQEGRE